MVAFTEEPRLYCDESWTPRRAFVMAGYLASFANWQRFDERWRAVLRDEGITEFKMKGCQAGETEFEGWPEERRRLVQERLISIIVTSGLVGIATGIDLGHYERLTPKLKALLHPKAWKPYTVAFQHEIEKATLEVRHLPSYERVAFVFDEQSEHQANALDVYASMKGAPHWYAPRMGAITFDNSKLHPGLQAADTLAYEFRRWLMEHVYLNHPTTGARWQMFALNRGKLVGGFFTEGALNQFTLALERERMVVSGNFDTEGRHKSRKRERPG